MSSFSSLCHQVVRRPLTLAALAGLALLLASTRPILAAESKKPGDGDRPAANEAKPPVSAKADDPGRTDDFGPPPSSPRGKDQLRPKPPRPRGRPGDPKERQPGPPPDEEGPPRQPGPPFGPDGLPRRPGFFGPGMPPGPLGRGPRPDWGSMEKSDPEAYKLVKAENELDRRTHELARDYRDASKDERAKLKAELKKLVTQQFETRQQRRTLELKRLEDELKRLRDAVDRREKERQQIIDKRVSELLNEETEPGF